ncbi:MAG: hypothetical protein NZ483_08530 [Verrucomicrobiae bacterium]|nr:hypothetical protein [Verrucomicrobiae bacterium]MDW8344298.1 hypothetical protein [Verrucomicrobiae bacterium]
MAKARQHVELTVRIAANVSSLSDVLSRIAQQGCNILAYCSYWDRDASVLHMVVDDPQLAKRTIEASGLPCRANPVILVQETDSVGAAARLGQTLQRAGVDILYSYASSSGAPVFWAVFKTTNDQEALRLLGATQPTRAVA